jgi:tetratricopeptide (TPR) repeat protein
MAMVYRVTGQPGRALELFEQVLPLVREIRHRAGEATALNNMATLLYEQGQYSRAVEYKTRAVAVLGQMGLNFDASGMSRAQIKQELEQMRRGEPLNLSSGSPATMPAYQLRVFVNTTIAVLTVALDKHEEWRDAVAGAFQKATSINAEHDAEFFTAILALLDGSSPELPADHPYADALRAIRDGVAAPPSPGDNTTDESALPADFVTRCIAALKGDDPAAKMALFNDLAQMAGATSDAGFKSLIDNVQKVFFGSDISSLGGNLSDVYAAAWQQIVAGLKGE